MNRQRILRIGELILTDFSVDDDPFSVEAIQIWFVFSLPSFANHL
jgi:hypothetical protein